MASFSVTFSNVLLTLLYLLPGFLLCRFRKVKPEHLGSFGTILLFLCGPCLFLNSLTALDPSPELTGDKKYISLRAAFLNPTVIAVAVGFVLYLLRAKDWLPDLFRSGIKTVGSMSTPLCLFGLGIRLATMDLKKLFAQPFVYAIVAAKLLLFPLFCFALANLLPYSHVFRASMLILGATPCASVILSLAEMHNSGQELAADVSLLTTLLSVITIPLLSLLV